MGSGSLGDVGAGMGGDALSLPPLCNFPTLLLLPCCCRGMRRLPELQRGSLNYNEAPLNVVGMSPEDRDILLKTRLPELQNLAAATCCCNLMCAPQSGCHAG